MAAPKKIQIIYEDDVPGKILSGVGTDYGSWCWWTRLKQTQKDQGPIKSNKRYKDTLHVDRDKRYNIHCETCVRYGCNHHHPEATLLKASPIAWSGQFPEGMLGHHVHMHMSEKYHHPDCPCIRGGSGSKSRNSSSKRKICLQGRLSISDINPVLRFSFEVPQMYLRTDPETPISSADQKINFVHIKGKFEKEAGEYATLDANLDPNRGIISGVFTDLPKSEIHLVKANQLIGDPNIDEIAVRFFENNKLDLLVWKFKHGYKENLLVPVNIDVSHKKSIIMDLQNENFIWSTHPDCNLFSDLIETNRLPMDDNSPISEFVKMNDEDTTKIVEIVFGKREYNVHFNNHEVSASLIELKPSKSEHPNCAIVVCNNTEDDLMAAAEIHQFGLKTEHFTKKEALIEHDMSLDESNIIHWGYRETDKANVIKKNSTKILFLRINGKGRLYLKVGSYMRTILAESIIANDNKLSIKRLVPDKSLEGVIPAIMKSSNITGFDNYENVPNQKEFNEIQIYDILRHRYSDLSNRSDKIHSGSISKALSRIQNIVDLDEIDEEIKNLPKATHQRFPWLFEAQYNKMLDDTGEDELPWQSATKGSFKLVGFEEGYFPRGDNDWSLLLSRKSWSQLKNDYSDLGEEDIKFLKFGHRLILTSAAEKIGIRELGNIESLDIYPTDPVEFLLAHFEGPGDPEIGKGDWDGNDWFNTAVEKKSNRFSLWSKNLSSAVVKSPLWTKKPESELLINLTNGEKCYLSIQRLWRRPIDEEDEEKHTQIFKLHLAKFREDEESPYETKSVTVFNSKTQKVPEVIKRYFDSRGPKEKQQILFQHLRDVFRAYLSASKSLSLIEKPALYLAPWNYRMSLLEKEESFSDWIFDSKPQNSSYVFSEISDVDPKFARELSNYVKSRLWLE